MKSLLFIVLIAIFHFEIASADSPLTSTHFSGPYADIPVIIEASKANGQLTPELLSYMANEANPVDIKVAAINELGWDHEVQNAEIFFNFLKEERGYSDFVDFQNTGTASDMLCYAYLKALDNYHDVKDALNCAEIALQKEPKSYTHNIITALIKAQYLMDYDSCEGYRIPDMVRRDHTLNSDMKKEAVDMIFNYTDLFRSACDEEKNPIRILPKNLEGVAVTADNENFNKSQAALKEKWKDVNNPLELTYTGTTSEGTFHLFFTDSIGQIYDFNGNNNLGEFRLYGPRGGAANPYCLGKTFRITWDWRVSELWFYWENWERVFGLLPSIVEIELAETH